MVRGPMLRSDAYVLLFSLLLGGLFAVARFNEFSAGAMLDDAIYVEMARSLAEGRGPVIYLHPQIAPQQSWAFPVGYPFLLSPIAYLLPESIQALKLFSLVVTVAMLFVLWSLLGNYTNAFERNVLLSLVVLNPWTIAYSNRVFSEATYALLSLSALLLFLKWLQRPSPSIPMAVGLSVLTGIAVSTRSIGIALIAACAVYLVIVQRWRFLAVFAASTAIGLLPQGIINYRAGHFLLTPGYQSQLLSHSQRVGERLLFMWDTFIGYLKELPAAIAPIFGNSVEAFAQKIDLGAFYTTAQIICGSLILIAVVAGGLRREERSADFSLVAVLYCLFYGAALINFSGNGHPVQLRLLVPLLPVLYYLLLRGLPVLYDGIRTSHIKPSRAAAFLLLAVLPLSILHNSYRSVHLMKDVSELSGRGFVDYAAGSAWIVEHTDADDVVMTYCPIERHIHFRRPVVDYGNRPPTTMDELNARVDAFGVRYLLIGPNSAATPRHLDSNDESILSLLRQASGGTYQLAYEDPERKVSIYRVLREM